MPSSELDSYRAQFEEIQEEAKDLIAGLDEARFNWQPAPGQWSIEECLAHLTMVGHWQVRNIEKAVDQAKARGINGTGPFHYGPVERYILQLTEPPVRTHARAPRRFVPAHGQPITAILPTFLHIQSQFLRQIELAADLHLRRVKVSSPIPFLRFSLGIAFAQAAAHERRHLHQARRVREKLNGKS